MRYVLSLSGGKASAVAAERAIARYGREAVTLWFADTSAESAELRRFLDDCLARWGGTIVNYRDGRTPWQVAEDEGMIFNQRFAPCTRILKIEPFRRFLATAPKPLTVLLGLDWREQDRLDAPRRNYEAIAGVSVDYPLLWKPYEYRPYETVLRDDMGIAPSAQYAKGLSHDNCGGACFKQGIEGWVTLYHADYRLFAEKRDWEAMMRERPKLGRYAILRDRRGGTMRPLTLAELEARIVANPSLFPPGGDGDDREGCFCAA